MAEDRPAPAESGSARPEEVHASGTLVRQLMPPLALSLALLSAAFATALLFLQERNVEERLAYDAAAITGAFRRSLDLQAGGISLALRSILRDGETVAALDARDAARLEARHRDLFPLLLREYRISHFYFHDASRVNLLRFHAPNRRGDRIDRHTLRAAERSGKTEWGLELGPLGTFTLRVVMPVRDGGRLLGYIEAGKEIEDLLAALVADPELQFSVLVRKERLSRADWEEGMRMLGRVADWDRLPDRVCVFSTLPGFPPPELPIPHPPRGKFDAEFAGRSFRVNAIPLPDVSGDPVAALLLLRDLTGAREGMSRIVRLLFLFAVPLLALLLGFHYLRLARADRIHAAQRTELAENEARYRALFEHAESGMAMYELLLDDSGKPFDFVVLEVNPAFERHTGMPLSAAVGRRMREQYGEKPDLAILDTFAEVVRTGRPARFEWYGAKSGRHFDISAYRVAARRFACTFQDVSERKRGETEDRMRLEETRRLNALMLDRERRVLEIKREVNGLCGELGRPAKYPSVGEGPA